MNDNSAGGIIRTKKTEKYFVANNAPFNDNRLSWEARGIMGYLLSKPDGWICRNHDLEKQGDAGEFKIRRILSELQECGYMTRERHQNKSGQFYWVTTIHEEPQTIPRLSTDGSPTDGSPTDGSPRDIEKTESVNTESVNTESSGATPEEVSAVKTQPSLATVFESHNDSSKRTRPPTTANDFLKWGRYQGETAIAMAEDEIQQSGWVINQPTFRHTAAAFVAATNIAIPSDTSTRGAWLKTFKDHKANWKTSELFNLYGLSAIKLQKDGIAISGPWTLTKTMWGIHNQNQSEFQEEQPLPVGDNRWR
jgi:hypothetical protein